MSNTVIKVENLGKQYHLGQVGTGTISHDLNRWWSRMRGKEDPYLKVGETNDRTKKGESNLVWALKDINFEVKQGEVLGIIGKNGAGKSTLLKILSRVTGPTVGDIKVKGRIAALLEVGTGFNPELSGRENIFLNGAILGMTKSEIKSKFDEIVDFSGVERYIDTPVKRYSSGMYVRLAFAVAAHLEPEILIVDEVLAVGDAEFQKKCLGKMKDVSGQGRTVLFVSHNLASIKTLCTRGLYLQNGLMQASGEVNEILNLYKRSSTGVFQMDAYSKLANRNNRCSASSNAAGHLRFSSIKIIDKDLNVVTTFNKGDHVFFEIEYEAFESVSNLQFAIRFESADTFDVISTNYFIISENAIEKGKKGKVRLKLNNIPLQPGDYLPYIVALGLNNQPYDIIDKSIINVPVLEIASPLNVNQALIQSETIIIN